MKVSTKLIKKLEDGIKSQIIAIEYPKQGADGFVFFITTVNGNEFSVKSSSDVKNDVLALKLLAQKCPSKIFPDLIAEVEYNGKIFIIMEKCPRTLLRFIHKSHKNDFIAPIIQALHQVHSIKAPYAGLISWIQQNYTWKQFLKYKYSGKHPWYNWDLIINRTGVDASLLRSSLEYVNIKIDSLKSNSTDYSLLHTDINQGNVFVDVKTKKVTGLIDWSEATFGDPLYDFARFRMNLWHRYNNESQKIHFKILELTDEEKAFEDFYFTLHVLDYINWTSESNDVDRLKLHQEYLNQLVR